LLAYKGVLYAKIDLKEKGGTDLHLYSTHTQASYFGSSLELFCESYYCRYKQILEMKKFILDMPKEPLDTLIALGDFN
jgi:hypothetical protein